jgi:hypothetical protein
MSSISRRNSRSVSSFSVRRLSTLAKAPAVYVSRVTVAEQWKAVGSELPDGWARVELRLELPDREAADRAAAALGPAGPYRAAPTVLTFSVARDGTAVGPENATRLLSRIPRGTLVLESSRAAVVPVPEKATSLVEAWDAAIASLPADWSDAFLELELTSTDYVEPAAVLCIQANPRRDGERAALLFRAARKAGYGVAPGMARRCLERCDEHGIRGTVQVLRVLSDTDHVGTQGPTWLVSGRTI